ncbi:MAG: ParB/RepB/Spo0J family partition protein [Gammaproteobacteria bacterium]|nr:ParB/RepB/Spo0J family partition protein [Gammaproteobacteria bacterium]MCP5458361.1 ParB/RepB/Spo0J family partition protein [Gammaproteobacteria bacterium]
MAKRASLTAAAKPRVSNLTLSLPTIEDWESAGELQMLAVTAIDPSPYQARESYNEDEIVALAASIEDVGIIQPIVVRPKSDERYELMAGHRRWLAAQRVGKTAIPAVIRTLDDRGAAALSLIENLQREDLNPMEAAQGLHRMLTDFQVAQKDLAKLLGRSKADITLTLGLLKLQSDVQELVKQGKLSAGHGRLLYRLPTAQQRSLAGMAVKKGWTVRRLEEAISDSKPKSNIESDRAKDPNIQRLETVLMEHIGLPVNIRSKKSGVGSLTIRFHSLEECEAIMERLGLDPEQYQS